MDNKLGFKLGLQQLSNCFCPGNSKNELVLEFAPNETENPENATLCEVRLHIPTNADPLHNQLTETANITASSGDSIVTIEDIPLVIPRGKYILTMYDSFIKLHGKTNTYKIMNRNITKTFLLPHADQVHVSFVIGLESPIRQGNTLYPFIVIEFNKD
jgi:structure-specific recognition protein 1